MKMNKRAEISIQTVFFIMMSIFMVAIIVFGFSKIFFVSETLSEMDALEIKNQVEEAFMHCEDPLAKGDKKTVKFKSDIFNSACVASGSDFDSVVNMFYDELERNNIDITQTDGQLASDMITDMRGVLGSGHNVILFNSNFAKNMDDSYILKGFTLVDSFKADFASDKVYCNFDLEGKGVFEMTLVC